jgi:hypothetical protein
MKPQKEGRTLLIERKETKAKQRIKRKNKRRRSKNRNRGQGKRRKRRTIACPSATPPSTPQLQPPP